MISVVTITCRQNARLKEAAESLIEAKPMSGFEWVVVDERLWYGETRPELQDLPFTVKHVPPKYTVWRGPDRKRIVDYPDPNNARNTGLLHADNDYVVFLDDCMIVTPKWLSVIERLAMRGDGFRSCVHIATHDGEAFSFRPSGDESLIPVSVTSCNGIMGAPTRAFEIIEGFDEAYAGEMGFEDLDAIVRLERISIAFFSCRSATAIHLANQEPLGPQGFPPERNRERFEALLRDPERYTPIP